MQGYNNGFCQGLVASSPLLETISFLIHTAYVFQEGKDFLIARKPHLQGFLLCHITNSYEELREKHFEVYAQQSSSHLKSVLHLRSASVYEFVQPNYFPQDLIKKLVQQTFGNKPGDYQKPENVVLTLQAVYYEIGFIISAALGIIFVLLLPLIGLCFCLCRYCDNCGGEMHQRQKKNANCRRGCFTSLLLVATLLSSIGVFFACAANQHLTSQVQGARGLISNNFRDLQMFLNGTPGQIDYLVNQYNITKKKVLSDLNSKYIFKRLGSEGACSHSFCSSLC
ncbi:prominin-1 [Crotalus adamanteus]|uniref:Prominin-1 n=1 Tax=Crotalus adamanteus TaxID=8729 RepID=A0AAW1BA27_CROAD